MQHLRRQICISQYILICLKLFTDDFNISLNSLYKTLPADSTFKISHKKYLDSKLQYINPEIENTL